MSKHCFPEKNSVFVFTLGEKTCQLVGALVVQLGCEAHNRGQSSQRRWEASLDLIHICFLGEVCCSNGLCSCSYCLVQNRNALVLRPGARPAISYYHPLAPNNKILHSISFLQSGNLLQPLQSGDTKRTKIIITQLHLRFAITL